MTRIIVRKLNGKGGMPHARSSVVSKSVHKPSGERTRILSVDANSPTFGNDLSIIFERNVAKAILPIAYVWDAMRERKLKVAKIRNPRLQRTLYMLHSSRHVRSSAIDPICCMIRAVRRVSGRRESLFCSKSRTAHAGITIK